MSFEDDLVEEFKMKGNKGKEHLEEWKKKTKEQQENVMRRAQEIVRQRQEEAKRSNKEFLLKMKIPGVNENPDK